MKRNLIWRGEVPRGHVEPEFLDQLRERMESTLLSDASDIKKVTLGDYLKLLALFEERRRVMGPEIEEVVVRWQDPPVNTEDADQTNT